MVNGAATTAKVTLKENQLVVQGYAIPIDKALKRGWGRVELPADAWAGEQRVPFRLRRGRRRCGSVIVSDDAAQSDPLDAALNAAADPARKYEATVLPVQTRGGNPVGRNRAGRLAGPAAEA